MSKDKPFLWFVGKRRPKDLSDQHTYREADSSARIATPKGHPNAKGVEGHALGGRRRGRK